MALIGNNLSTILINFITKFTFLFGIVINNSDMNDIQTKKIKIISPIISISLLYTKCIWFNFLWFYYKYVIKYQTIFFVLTKYL